MAELFLRLNALGMIQQIYVNHLFTIEHKPQSVFSLFDEATNQLINRALTESSHESKTVLENDKYPTILLRSAIQNLFVYVSTVAFDKNQRDQLEHLIDLAIDLYSSNVPLGAADAKGFYEQMQLLNNELVNKSRTIEKMNRQLHDLNLKQEELLRTDPLTKLTSRYVFPEQIDAKIAAYPGKKGLFCYLDIDDFKSVNDTYGHLAGDDYLVEFARRLKSAPIKNALAMRIAGDEFGIFVYNLDEVNEALCQQIWAILQDSVARPINIGKHPVPVAFSVGFAAFPDDSQNIHHLFDDADQAMYVAKRKGKNLFTCYNCIKKTESLSKK